ncbi:MAG: Maf family protein [Gammaproteobacteria bacterium]
MTQRPPIVLASSSAHRRDLLRRLLPSFDYVAPAVDESAEPREAPDALARRLGELKARSVAAGRPEAIVIGGDQVPVLDGKPLKKPGDRNNAIRQLTACSGRTVRFLTAVTVIAPGRRAEHGLDNTIVRFRTLNPATIERYIDAERPFDCAGSFKAEGLGIALFESIETSDPTALQGLPLIWLTACLNRFGIDLP